MSRLTFRRTLHAQADLRRSLEGPFALIGTVGVSNAELAPNRSYLDVYGWAGLSWSPGENDK